MRVVLILVIGLTFTLIDCKPRKNPRDDYDDNIGEDDIDPRVTNVGKIGKQEDQKKNDAPTAPSLIGKQNDQKKNDAPTAPTLIGKQNDQKKNDAPTAPTLIGKQDAVTDKTLGGSFNLFGQPPTIFTR